jgi:hypothetical protein
MVAREKFNIGDRVRLNDSWQQTNRSRATRLGTVRGFGYRPEIVKVQRDGLKTATAWHMSFWDRIEVPPKSDGEGNLRGRAIEAITGERGVVVTRTRGDRWAVDLERTGRCCLDRSEFCLVHVGGKAS